MATKARTGVSRRRPRTAGARRAHRGLELTDADLELKVKGYTNAEVRIWRNPATASEAVAYRTWRIDLVPPGSKLRIETRIPAGLVGDAWFCVSSVLGEWGSFDGTWADSFPVFPFPVKEWKRYPAQSKSERLTAEIDALAGPFLVVLATGIEKYRSTMPDQHLTTARTWNGEDLFCPDETVEINNKRVIPARAKNAAKQAAIVVPVPGDVPQISWSSKPPKKGTGQPPLKPRITWRWNGKAHCFQRVAVVLVGDQKGPLPSGYIQVK